MVSFAFPIPLLAVLVVGLVLSRVPHVMLDADGEPHRLVVALYWLGALALVALHAGTWPLNEDEIFWLTSSWAAQHGEMPGTLPMRHLPFRPLLTLGLPPSQTIILSRIVLCSVALLCGLVMARLARRMGCRVTVASFAGASTFLALGTLAGMIIPRAEYLACAAFTLGLSFLLAPPRRWPRACSTVAALTFITLAAATSMRHLVFPLAAIVVAVLASDPARRAKALLWSALGMALALAPTIGYIMATDSWAAVYQTNVTDVVQAGWVDAAAPASFPLLLMIAAAAGIALGWRKTNRPLAVTALTVMWMAATAAQLLNPQKMNYTLGPWLVVSLALAVVAIEDLLSGEAGPARNRWVALSLAIVGLSAFGKPQELLRGPALAGDVRQLVSQLHLVDWLGEVAGAGPVMCVTPYHPIRVANAWPVWNAWVYCGVASPALSQRLNADLETNLSSGRPTVIAWDPVRRSRLPNVLCYATDKGGIPLDRMPALAARLAAHYRLVEWAQPLPPEISGGRFLIRRDVPLDNRVTPLNDDTILHWQDE